MAAPKVHVLGILGTTDVAANQDRWMAVDFAIMRDLFSEADTSAWFSAAILDNRDWPIIIGDPHSERLQLTRTVPSASQVNVVPLTALKTRFLHAVSHTAAQQEDTIVLVLCGHGDEDTGDLIIGGEVEYRDPLAKEDIELALSTLDTPQKRIFVISKACYSSLWRSDKWTLFAASDSHQTSAAMSTSGSGEGRGSGSGFTYALLAQRVGEHGLTAPHPVPKVDLPDGTYGKGPVIVRDTPVAARMHEPTARAKDTRPSTQEAHEFMESLKSTMGRTYKDADFILHPSSSLPSELPIRPFTSAFLPRLQVVDSSPPPDANSNEPEEAVGAVQSHAEDMHPLTFAEKTELGYLASEYNKTPHPNVSIDVAVNMMAAQVARGVALQSDAHERILLEKLRYRDRDSRRASAIAEYLGWKTEGAVGEWAHGNGLKEMLEAEAHGAAVATEFFLGAGVGARWWDPKQTSVNSHRRPWKTMGPGAWLVDAWSEAGRPTVEEKDWKRAVGHANNVVASGGKNEWWH